MEKKIAIFEIFVLILAGFSFSYFIHETGGSNIGISGESEVITWLRKKILNYLSGGLVSAEEGLWTCLKDLNGSICQEYSADSCNDVCDGDCIPTKRDETSECKLGTCVDPNEGTCSAQSPRSECENNGGKWSEQEPAECSPGCCLIGGNANFITENTCGILSGRMGQEYDWQNVDNELECLVLGDKQVKGACVFEKDFENNCKFGTDAECLSMGGDFHEGYLCTNPELNTTCEKTFDTSCSDSGDEVYFKDSCGNIANIYDSKKKNNEDYWSFVVSKNESCSLDGGLGNQNSCGNCNYLLGNSCGEPREGVDDNPLEGNFVCRDLSCVDEWGDKRKQGESWCAFDSKIGVDGDKANKKRSVDLPGSRHYRRVCIDGETRTEPCADFRNEICSESRDEEIGFSSAACRINSWQTCMDANSDKDKLDKCETNTDCFLKEVRIDDFKFDVCAPKYPPGFDLKAQNGGDVGQSICSAATQTCKVIEVKGFGGWSCKVNCGCLTNKFAETMNNLCTSLGDCGGDVNLEGTFTDSGYNVKHSKKLGKNYISGLQDYTNPEKGQHADTLSKEEIAALFGLDPNDPEFENKIGEIIGKLGVGALGVVLVAYGYELGFSALYGLITSGAGIDVGILSWGPTGNAFANVLGGAAAGAAIGFVVGKLFGLQGDAMLAVVIAGAAAGLATMLGAFSGGTAPALLSTGFLLPVIIIVIVMAVVMKLLGIGKSRTINVGFTCNAWQPPLGGADCGKCTEGDLPCSKYKCQSYGQTCEFVNEGTGEEMCIDSSPNDVTAPKISPNYDAIQEPFDYSDVKDNGFKIINKDTECIPAYTRVDFGVSLNEAGQCKYDTEHTDDFDSMGFDFGESSLFKKDHVSAFILPSLESLGEGGFDPNRRADFNMYVRCRDGSGNFNQNEYAISFCVSPENDTTPPILKDFNPESPSYVTLNSTEKDVSFYTNEPAECKWSSEDKDYSMMENLVGCQKDINDMTLFGWSCNVTLPIQEGNSSDYYFRCEDQPWKNESRNTNKESVNYQIVKTTTPLTIDKVNLNPEPDENEIISVGNEPVILNLEVKTSGGAPGNIYCSYGFGGENNLARFFETGGEIHKQKFSSLFSGNYNIGIGCEDLAGNVAEDSAKFKIEVDDTGPAITRLYFQGGVLNVVTDENSVCGYDYNSCGFSFDNGTEMSGSGLVHSVDFDQSLNYYIKCKDDWGNTGECTTVRAGY